MRAIIRCAVVAISRALEEQREGGISAERRRSSMAITSSIAMPFEQSKTSGSDVDRALGVVERIGLIRPAGSKRKRELSGILS